MTRVVVHGAGRMARRVVARLQGFKNFELVGIVSRNRPDEDLGTNWFPSLSELNTPVDLLIDFTLPKGTRDAASWCAANEVVLLSGTTGLSDDDFSELKSAALKVPVLWAPNLSYGVALATALVRHASAALGTDANVSIKDIHHRHKLDAPSGTALALGAAVKDGCSGHLSGGESIEPAYSSVREGEVIGEHAVSFTLPDEIIEINHKALDRDVFALGAIKAGEWVVQQESGFYSSGDWLGLDGT